jgi:predicted nucleic acid-binding protein
VVNEITRDSGVSFEDAVGDALTAASAEQAGATQLNFEDLNSGQIIAGVQIVSPLMTE